MNPHPLHTLIADDSEDDRLLFRRALRSNPLYKPVAAVEDGVEAVAYLAGFGRYCNRERFPFPDLLLLDFQMPGYNGVEVLSWVRKQSKQPKVILWSDSIELLEKSMVPQLAADIVCAKPRTRDETMNILHRLWITGHPAAPTRLSRPHTHHKLS